MAKKSRQKKVEDISLKIKGNGYVLCYTLYEKQSGSGYNGYSYVGQKERVYGEDDVMEAVKDMQKLRDELYSDEVDDMLKSEDED
jgi:hypothetical protein